MATNPIPVRNAELMLLSMRCLAGATSLGASIPLLINTAAIIGADRAALREAENAFRAARSELNPRYAALQLAMADGRIFCTRARDALKRLCGNQFNQTWIPTGFTRSTAIPQLEGELTALVEDLAGFLTAHPDHGSPDQGVTAAAATALLERLQGARAAIDTQRMVADERKPVRDEKLKALRKRLSGLCKELSLRLEPLDGRWREFGFNLPGASSIPEPPENVQVNNHAPLQLLVSCDPARNATHYRFYHQRPDLDEEPIFSGSTTDPLSILTGLTPGQSYLIYASATNAGGESELSEPTTAVVHLAAAA